MKSLYLLFFIISTVFAQDITRTNIFLREASDSIISKIEKLNDFEHPLMKRIDYNFADSEWSVFSEKDYEYNNNLLIKSTEYRYFGYIDSVDVFMIEEYTYDNQLNRNLIEVYSERHNDWNDPTIYSRIQFEYNENNDIIKRTIQSMINSEWMNVMKEELFYNSSSFVDKYLFYMWDGNSEWVIASTVDYVTYDSNNSLLESTQKDCFNGECTDKYKDFYEYDNSNNQTRHVHQWMQASGWENFSQNTVEFNNNSQKLVDLFQHWSNDENEWYNASKQTYNYGQDNNLILSISQRWDYYASNPDWINSQQDFHSYADGYRTKTISQAFDDEWLNQTKTIFQYEGITKIEEQNSIVDNYLLFQNYPNPFNPSTIISYSLPQSGFVQLKVYDMLGREIKTLVNKEQSLGNYEIEFNAKNLTSGVYFYKLQSGDFSEIKKLILLR